MVAGKLDLVPRYRQKVRFVPLGAGAPVWIDDPHFSLDYHLRHTAIPRRAARSSCARWPRACSPSTSTATSRCGSCGWSRASPDGRWALLSKVHHCMVDGVAATDLMSVMFSDTTERAAARRWVRAAARALRDRGARCARSPTTRAPSGQHADAAARRRARRARRSRARRRPRARRSRPARACAPSPSSSLTGPIGPHRRWSWADGAAQPTSRPSAPSSAAPSTTSCSRSSPNGFRELLRLARRGARRRTPSCARWCPCRCAARGERGVYNNRVSAVFAGLPVGLDRPARAPGARSAPRWTGSRSPSRPSRATCSRSLSGFAPPLLLALGSRLVTLSPRLNMHTATTNVPGPAAAGADARAADARVLPVRARRRLDPDRRRDLLLRRRPLLRRHRRLRRRARHRRADAAASRARWRSCSRSPTRRRHRQEERTKPAKPAKRQKRRAAAARPGERRPASRSGRRRRRRGPARPARRPAGREAAAEALPRARSGSPPRSASRPAASTSSAMCWSASSFSQRPTACAGSGRLNEVALGERAVEAAQHLELRRPSRCPRRRPRCRGAARARSRPRRSSPCRGRSSSPRRTSGRS